MGTVSSNRQKEQHTTNEKEEKIQDYHNTEENITGETSIERSHPAFTGSLRSWSQNSTHYNVTNFTWVYISFLYQCSQYRGKQLVWKCILEAATFCLAKCSPLCRDNDNIISILICSTVFGQAS
jgi:hypothetical protein